MACYLIRAGDTDRVKIGYAVDVDSRRRELQSGCWERLIHLRTWEGNRFTEGWLHRRFSSCRIARDWFIFDSAMMEVEPPAMIEVAHTSSTLLSPFEIEARARANGMSKKQLCAKAGIAESTLTRWKNGATTPGIEVYQRLRDASQPQ